MKIAKRLWHMIRVLYYMLHKNIAKHKLMLNLNFNLLLERSKIVGKSIGNLLAIHHHHHHHHEYDLDRLCQYIDPRDIEFSFSSSRNNTPSHVTKRKRKNDHHHQVPPNIAEAFEILNAAEACAFDDFNPRVRQVRVTDSPFPIRSEVERGGNQVDREAEEFIRRFYEHLRLQQ